MADLSLLTARRVAAVLAAAALLVACSQTAPAQLPTVRDPGQLARSWLTVHNRKEHDLRDALETACELIECAPVERVDIRTLPVAFKRGDLSADAALGQSLLADYPAYFEGYY